LVEVVAPTEGPVLESAVAHVAEKHRPLVAGDTLALRVVDGVTSDEHQVLPAAVCEVNEAGPPADIDPAQSSDPRRVGAVAEEVLLERRARPPVVVIQGTPLALVIRHEERGETTAVVVADVDAAAATGVAAVINGRPALRGFLGEPELARRAPVEVKEVIDRV